MTKLDILILRACKVEYPVSRLETIYRRFWVSNPSKIRVHSIMAHRILRIIQETSLDKDRLLVSVFDDLHPQNHWRHGMEGDPYETQMLKVLVYTLRYAKIDDLPEDFIPPIRFRRS